MNGERLGVVLADGPALRVLDLRAAAEARDPSQALVSMNALMDAGASGLQHAYVAIEWAQREGEAAWFRAESEVDWRVPLEVRTCIAGGRNFGSHLEESLAYWKERGVQAHTEIPMGFVKLANSMVPTRSIVQRPPETRWFDYDIEAVAVIGWPVERVSEKDALSTVFGYTILNDLSARELQRKEMQNQSILLGKNFPGLGPLGPWIVTADEIPDPSVMEVELSVNGEVRQHASCADLIFTFPAMIAHWSCTGLARGDLVTTGSPEGVAISRKPDPEPFFLQPGDTVRTTVDRIGTLETVFSSRSAFCTALKAVRDASAWAGCAFCSLASSAWARRAAMRSRSTSDSRRRSCAK
ncbi:fumarylacetoacetate hydrolase family protein [Variovorax sp. J31P207]|uniref:fumarylacetoacetate hydrolase family protein n=1 Tax=Variovorax sp. J31P207 TaxID=3053510 RepID=UPI0025790690|nr:fumarylacetoacetate hydrolase family protein [Variovorax sp. J31P207]MDM0071694.1 fumarylacetoacetate hydrolase family protein [Variovorax sp. J31P207]